ncbi:unnamed protein product [Aphanomyces euteiches]
MEFDAPSFADAPVALAKTVTATVALAPGQVIFAESAIVASAGGVEPDDGFHEEGCEDEECGGCAEIDDEDAKDTLDEDEVDKVSAYVVENFDALMETCEPVEALVAVDARKNLFKLFHLIEQPDHAGLLNQLLAVEIVQNNVASHLEAAKVLREAHSGVIPAALSDDQVAQLIGAIHKDSTPLDDLDGSGLFLYVPKLKHSCTPNATYTDAGASVWVTAIQPIAAGEDITVDFFDTHFMPAAERAIVLAEEGYECSCGVCNGTAPDLTRSFKCKACPTGIVNPTKNVFACASCGAKFDDETIAAVEMEETTLLNDLEIESLEQMNALIEGSHLHRYHHIFYSAMEALLEDDADDEDDDENEEEATTGLTDEQSLAVLNDELAAFNYVVPFPHSEKVALYDSIAQAHLGLGQIEKATEAYTQAHAMSQTVFGPDAKNTQLFHRLMTNTPTTPEEIAAAYGFELDDGEDDE